VVDSFRVVEEFISDPANDPISFFIKVIFSSHIEHYWNQGCDEAER
jgi:hypothetical protein